MDNDLDAIQLIGGKKGCEAFDSIEVRDTIWEVGVEGFMMLGVVTGEKVASGILTGN